MEKKDFIKAVYKEPIIHAVITDLREFEHIRHEDYSWYLGLRNVVVDKKPLHLLWAYGDLHCHHQGFHMTERDYPTRACLVLNSSETITLQKFQTDLNQDDLHLNSLHDYFIIPNESLSQICDASEIMIYGYEWKEGQEERVIHDPVSPKVFRAYYSIFVSENRYKNPFEGFSPTYNSLGDRVFGRIANIRCK